MSKRFDVLVSLNPGEFAVVSTWETEEQAKRAIKAQAREVRAYAKLGLKVEYSVRDNSNV